MFQQAYEHVDSSGSSDIGPATAHAFLTDAEGQEGTDATVGTEEENSCMESSSADMSLNTDTTLNQQEISMRT